MDVSEVSNVFVFALAEIVPGHAEARHLDALLVGGGGGVVLLLVDLVAGGVKTTGDAVTDGVLAGDVALGLLLVALLGGGGGGTLDGLGNVVGGVLGEVVREGHCMNM